MHDISLALFHFVLQDGRPAGEAAAPVRLLQLYSRTVPCTVKPLLARGDTDLGICRGHYAQIA